MSDDVKKKLEDLAANVEEIMGSVSAVKGAAFADITATNFEAMQLMDCLHRACAVAATENAEFAHLMRETGMTLLSNIVARVCDPLSEDEVKESMTIASSLMKRRNGTATQIAKGMRDAE